MDNGSTDGSLELLSREFPEVRAISLRENLGFAAAANAGINASDSELAALLNNDTEQEPEWLGALVRAADSHRDAGSFASKMLDFHDRRTLDGAGDALRLSGLPYRIGHGERDRGQFDAPGYVFGACGAAALYRRRMLEDIGLFDEDFVSYCEDVDLGFRAQLSGYGCYYVPEAVIYHMGGASTGGKRSATATTLGTRNSLSLLVKNLPLSVAPHLLPFFVAGQLARLLTATATGNPRAHLEGLAGAWTHLPLMREKRRGIQDERKVSDLGIRRVILSSSLEATASVARRVRERLIPRASA